MFEKVKKCVISLEKCALISGFEVSKVIYYI